MPFRWPCDWNRPLSKEEREIARRLDRLTQEQVQDMEKPACEPKEYFGQEI